MAIENTKVDTGPEIFIGLVGAVGTDLSEIYSAIAKELSSVGYRTTEIRLSSVMYELSKISEDETLKQLSAIKEDYEDKRINAYMDAGDKIRVAMEDGSAVAKLAINKIKLCRKKSGCEKDQVCYRTAYILNSIKHPGEVKMLRELYGNSFFLISVYEPKSERLKRLTDKIARSHHRAWTENTQNVADSLIERDQKDEGGRFGQDVRDAFPLADLFMSVKNQENELRRFVELLFGNPFITPTKDEYSMFHAHAAALRSSDLSRQVGAVIATEEAEIVATGCNEVPKAGGGKVWECSVDNDQDYRDFRLGSDANARTRHELVTELLEKLKDNKMLVDGVCDGRTPAELAEYMFEKENDGILIGTRLGSLIEFGRIVHAEMSSIMEAARRGLAVKDTILYCTTFPCHVCTRHIIDAGIKRVVYVEPYPKSMAKQFYTNSIRVDNDVADENAVEFEPFLGIAPRRYFDFFQMTARKDKYGYARKWNPSSSKLRFSGFFTTYLESESTHINEFQEKAEKVGLMSAAK